MKYSKVSEECLARIARIIGPTSASSYALKEIEKRRARGEKPVCVAIGDASIVVMDETDLADEGGTK